jgi:hypothetical protein
MIDLKCFSQNWITERARTLHCQQELLERAIIAFQLLANLGESGLPFQFKGGTSLLLRLPAIRRLSIDIDIVTQATPDQVPAALESFGRQAPFYYFSHDARRDAALPPKKHFQFLFNSALTNMRQPVLLDVLFEPAPMPHIEPVAIQTPFFECTRAVHVQVPTINALLGDKLTAFAPTTIGIPYTSGGETRQTDIIKQLFDVAALFDAATDLQVVAEVHRHIHARQCIYRGHPYAIAETLDDAIQAAVLLTAHDLPGFQNTDNSRLLRNGVTSLQNHLVNCRFGPDEARQAAGKLACLAAWIKRRPAHRPIESLRYDADRVSELKDKTIGPPWSVLDRLKRINPEAFHYWWHAHQLNHATGL